MKTSYLPLSALAALIISLAVPAHGQTTIVASSSAPTAGSLDIDEYNDSGSPNGGQDYSNNPPMGQTFTTLSDPSGYLLNSVTLQGSGGAGNGYEANWYTLTLYTISGTTLTPISTTPQFFAFADTSGATNYASDYLTFNLATPIALAADTQYAFTLANWGSAYLGFAESSSDTYAGGAAFNGTPVDANSYPNATIATSTGSTHGYDRSFDIGLTAAPEPSTWAMMFGGVAVLLGLLRFRRRTL